MATNYNQSRIKMFRRCQKQYAFRYDYSEYYDAEPDTEMVPSRKRLPLYTGSWMHALQEAHHHSWAGVKKWKFVFGEGRQRITASVKSWRDVHDILTQQYEGLFEEEKEDLGDVDLPTECERLFKAYLKFWAEDSVRYQVAVANDRPLIEMVVTASLKSLGLKKSAFKGRIDLVVEDREYGGLWIWDAKWVGKIPPPDERMMSPQACLYVWALRELGLDIRGFVFNYGRTKAPAIPRVLQRPKGMLSMASRMDTDYATYLRAIKDNHGAQWKRYKDYYKPKLAELKGREALWFDRQRIPVEDDRIARALGEYVATVTDIQRRITDRHLIPRSYFYNCKFGCDYHSLCVAEFQGLEIEPLIQRTMMFDAERYGKEDLLNA